jgi:hypothetical protein
MGSAHSLRADRYRERAAEAKDRAAQEKTPSIKSAYEEVARSWLLLAEEMEWTERRGSSRRDEDMSTHRSNSMIGKPPETVHYQGRTPNSH